MARKTGSRSSAAASTTNYLTTATAMSSPVHSSTAVYASATANTTGGTAPAEPPSPGHPAPYVEDHLTFVPDFETSASISSTSMARKRVQPKSKNHGRFPCSIPGCYAVANHLSSMCRHKWGHLPQRLLPACRGHLPNGAPCPVRYQGRADTMKRHWLTHHTNEGPWVPDRYPPFEDLWKLVQEGEIVLTPPSKYVYDAPLPADEEAASGSGMPSRTVESNSERDGVSTGPRRGAQNSIGVSRAMGTVDGYSVRAVTGSPMATVRLSRGNNRPWRYSDPVNGPFEDDEGAEMDEGCTPAENEYTDVDMEDVTQEEPGPRHAATSPSHHSVLYSPTHSHYSQRSNSNPRSPVSIRSLTTADHDVHIHVPPVIVPPITPRISSSGESIITHRYPLSPASNYPSLPTSSMRNQFATYDGAYRHEHKKSNSMDALGLLASSAIREHRHIYEPENCNPNSLAQDQGLKGTESNGLVVVKGQYVYGHKKGSPPGPGYTPASIPHSELSLLSHPPTDWFPSSSLPHPPSGPTAKRAASPAYTNESPESSPFTCLHASQGIQDAHPHAPLSRPMTVASH